VLIYLLRSSRIADTPGVVERERGLSIEGRQLVRAIGSKIRLTEEPSFDHFFTSPLPAAVQTAELFAERTDYVGVVETLPLLVADTPPAVIASQILARGQTIIVVADEPVLAALGAFLVGRPTFPPAAHAQVSVIEDRKPAWLLRPGELGRQLLLVA
jgi:phosphohistidine phosphatase SixA